MLPVPTVDGDALELDVEGLLANGSAYVRWRNVALEVPPAAPGDRLRVWVTPGRLQRPEVVRSELIRSGDNRRAPRCRHAEVCGGCDWQHVADAVQWREKVSTAKQIIAKGGTSFATTAAWSEFPALEKFEYRRRLVLHVQRGAVGLYGRQSHDLIQVEQCSVVRPALGGVAAHLRELLSRDLRSVAEIRAIEHDGRVSVSLHSADTWRETEANRLARRILDSSGYVGVVCVGPTIGDRAFEFGAPVLVTEEGLLRPDVFLQANASMNRQLRKEVAAVVADRQPRHVVELYAGSGNFTSAYAALAAKVTTVEHHGPATDLARRWYAHAQITNVRSIADSVEDGARNLVRDNQRAELLMLDPPRSGCAAVADIARGLRAKTIAYVSCDVSTFARDARRLHAAGYALKGVQVYDFFPQTRHVEVFGVFEVATSPGPRRG